MSLRVATGAEASSVIEGVRSPVRRSEEDGIVLEGEVSLK